MWLKSTLFILWFSAIFAQASAQLPIQTISESTYQQALQQVKITKNEKQLLPIADLQQRIAYWIPDNSPSLIETLQKYTDVQKLNTQQKDVDVIIVKLTKTAQLSATDFLSQKTKAKKILIAPPSMTAPKYYDAVITISEDNPMTQSIAAQLIFGGITNKNGTFRLGYAPPEAVHIDSKKLKDSIQAIIQYGIEKGAFPGAQVLVAKDGKIIYHQAFGSPTFDNKRPVSIHDIYDLASVSKVTTALPALMILNGEGKFNLDAPMKELWPDFKNTNKADITWRNVLAHNARLQPWIPYWKNTLRKQPKRNGWRYKRFTFKDHRTRKYSVKITDNLWLNKRYRKKIFKAIKETPLNEKPGYKYSGLAFYIFPTIVEQVTGDEFEHFLKSKIYQPIGANTLTFNPLRFYPKSRIIPTELDTFFRMEQIHGTVHDEGAIMMGGINGNAGLFGTANDLAKLWEMYLNNGQYGTNKIINSKVLKEFERCQFCDQGNHRGLGFDKPQIKYNANKASYAKDASANTFGHAGYTGTLVWADPDNQLLFIFFSNRVYPTRNNRKLYTLDIRPRLHNAIYQAIKK